MNYRVKSFSIPILDLSRKIGKVVINKDRKQRVRLNGQTSEWRNVTTGVSQVPFWDHCYF